MATFVALSSVAFVIALVAMIIGSVALGTQKDGTTGTRGPEGPPGSEGSVGSTGAPGPAGPTTIQMVYFAGKVEMLSQQQYLFPNGDTATDAVVTTPNPTNEWIATTDTNRLVLQWNFIPASFPGGDQIISVWIGDVQLSYDAAFVLVGTRVFIPPATVVKGTVIKVSVRVGDAGQYIANLQMFS